MWEVSTLVVCGVEKQVDIKFPVWDIIHRVSWIQAVKIHTINSVLISKQTVAPEGGVCVRVSRQNTILYQDMSLRP